MVSRERLVRLAERAAGVATARRVRVVAQLLLAAALVFALLHLRSTWHASHVHLGHVDWFVLIAAFGAASGGVVAPGFIWLAILQRLGLKPRARWAGLFFQAQLGKYIPGAVWQYAGRTAFARTEGIPVKPVALSLPLELLAGMTAVGGAALLLLGWLGALGLAVGATAVAVAPRALEAVRSSSHSCTLGPDRTERIAAALSTGTVLYVVAWLIMGCGFWLTARALADAPVGDLSFFIGAYAVAWLVGFVAIYAPGGLGVREALIVLLLHRRLGSADALVVAAAYRGILTTVDLLAATVAFAVGRARRRLPSSRQSHAGVQG